MVLAHYFSIVVGILGGALTSQFPGFTLQYMQNLNGRIDELEPIVQEFKADLIQYNYTVDSVLDECDDNGAVDHGLLSALCDSFLDVVVRYDTLQEHYDTLTAQSDYKRPFVLAKTAHEDIVQSVMKEFKPAVPVDESGLVFAAVGVVLFWILFHVLLGILCLPCRQGKSRRAERRRKEKEQHLAQQQHRIYDAHVL
jgi:hypothetical protein